MEWSYEEEWFEEGNVCKKIKGFLETNGFIITKFNDDKRSKGHDIEAKKNNDVFIVEVKGFPSDKYVSGGRKGQIKKMNPKAQARLWFAEAILALIKAKSKNPKDIICIGLPDDEFQTYRDLISEIQLFIKLFGLICILVDKNGKPQYVE